MKPSHDQDVDNELTVRSAGREPSQGRCDLVVRAEREIRSPLGALRVLLEETRNAMGAEFRERALDEIERTGRALDDLMAWLAPRPDRSVDCTCAALMDGVRASLTSAELARCEFAVDDPDIRFECDGRLIADTVSRIVRQAVSSMTSDEDAVLVHAHSTDDQTTVSIVERPGDAERSGARRTAETGTLAEALMTRDVHRAGGRASLHRSGGQRCYVLVLPHHRPNEERGVA